MNAKKHPPVDLPDPSLNPTRKVESMSSIAAELLLQEQDGHFDERRFEERRFEEGRFEEGRFEEGRFEEGRFEEGRFDEQSGRRLRSNRPAALDTYAEPPQPLQTEPWRPVYSDSAAWQSQAWPPGAPAFASAPPPATRSIALRIALLVVGALVLIAVSVTITLLVTR